jgi:azurin
MPKQAMSHNFVLFKPMSDADVSAICMAASTKTPEYIPDDMSKVIAKTKMLGPKETDKIQITVPVEPGTYPYVCTFRGDFALMRGNLVVKAK